MKILHLEDSELDHVLVKRELQRNLTDVEVHRVETIVDLAQKISTGGFDVVLADFRLTGFDAISAWSEVSKITHCPPFILVSGAIGEPAAVEAIQCGISDYIHKQNLSSLTRIIQRTLEMERVRTAKEAAQVALEASEKRLSKFAEHLQSTIENERTAIAREIHDDIGGALAAVKLELGWLSRHSTQADQHKHLESAHAMLQQALSATQRIMMDLRPAILDQGLHPALEWLVNSFEKRSETPTAFKANRDRYNLEPSIQLTAYRTVQEALTNISKYASCSKVHVEVSDAGGVLTVEISDDGIGILPSDLQKATSYGIKGLQERAKSVGGWIDVSTNRFNGTSIILSIPLVMTAPTTLNGPFE
jgi:signal transduction histidine kinase